MKKTAVYAGSFNPFTIGHSDILRRGLEIFDEIIVVRGVNRSKGIDSSGCDDLKWLEEKYENVRVICWEGLTVSCAREYGAKFLLRGARSAADFETERNLADVNRELAGLETVILLSRPELSMVSSSMIREMEWFGCDASKYYAKNEE